MSSTLEGRIDDLEQRLGRLEEAAAGASFAYELPDGSGCAVVSFDLPKDHWIYDRTAGQHEAPLPLGARDGGVAYITHAGDAQVASESAKPDMLPGYSRFQTVTRIIELDRERMAPKVRAAARVAIREATEYGKVKDFDPDALAQAFVRAVLG